MLPPNSTPFDIMVVLEVIGPEGSIDQISFSVVQPEVETIKVNFYIGKLVRIYEFTNTYICNNILVSIMMYIYRMEIQHNQP